MPQPHGILFLADDAVVLRPWLSLKSDLLNRNSMVLPALFNSLANYSVIGKFSQGIGNWLNEESWNGLISARASMTKTEQNRCGSDAYWANADVVYVPVFQASRFSHLASVFSSYNVNVEWALPMITIALGGKESLLGAADLVKVCQVWAESREYMESIVGEPRNFANCTTLPPNDVDDVAFAHPFKLSNNEFMSGLAIMYSTIFSGVDHCQKDCNRIADCHGFSYTRGPGSRCELFGAGARDCKYTEGSDLYLKGR